MADKQKPQLCDEDRARLKALVKAQVRDLLSRREELQQQAATTRQVWNALLASPTWSIVHNDNKPADAAAVADELWSMTPTVTKR